MCAIIHVYSTWPWCVKLASTTLERSADIKIGRSPPGVRRNRKSREYSLGGVWSGLEMCVSICCNRLYECGKKNNILKICSSQEMSWDLTLLKDFFFIGVGVVFSLAFDLLMKRMCFSPEVKWRLWLCEVREAVRTSSREARHSQYPLCWVSVCGWVLAVKAHWLYMWFWLWRWLVYAHFLV